MFRTESATSQVTIMLTMMSPTTKNKTMTILLLTLNNAGDLPAGPRMCKRATRSMSVPAKLSGLSPRLHVRPALRQPRSAPTQRP